MPEPTAEVNDASPSSHRPARQTGSSSRWIAVAALVISLIAAGAAGWALLRPASPSATPAVAPQSGDPKTTACDAYRTVTTAVSLQTHADAGAEVQGVAANARLAMSGGATYLLAHLNPGTPPELADTIRTFAAGLQDISMNALAGVPNEEPAQAERLRNAEAANSRIAALCK